MLCWLGGFAAALPAQAARATGLPPSTAGRVLRELRRRGWIQSVPGPVAGAVRLTRAGRAQARRLGCGPADRLAPGPAGLDAALARVDLATALGASGLGNWRAGQLEAPDGTRRAVLLILRHTPPARLHAAIGRGLAATGRPPLVCAVPDQLAAVAASTSIAEVRCFTPAHLRGRTAAGPGWRPPDGTRPPSAAQRALLTELARYGHAAAPQLAALCGLLPDAARRHLRRLSAAGLAWSDGLRPSPAWSATAAGLAAIGSRLPPAARLPARRRHSLALVDLAIRLASGGAAFTTERELRSEHLRRFGPGALPPPDGRLALADGRRVLLELELSRKPTAALKAMAARHLAAGTADAVWFVVAPAHLASYRRRLAADGRLRVLPWEAGIRHTAAYPGGGGAALEPPGADDVLNHEGSGRADGVEGSW